jgi:hypothetical protein
LKGDCATPRRPSKALTTTLQFLIDRQSADGAWRDFLLKPGRSDAWVTSYVGLRLLQIERTFSFDALRRPIATAMRFVERSRNANGGWGYNAICPPDADSTAHAILFLRVAGATPTLRDYRDLSRFQLPDGAFATYRRGDALEGWCTGHPDVTAVALRALAAVLPSHHRILRHGYARLAAYLKRREPLASYWWPSVFYLARELRALSRECSNAPVFELPQLAITNDAGCFARSLAIELAMLDDGETNVEAQLRALRRMQIADGSWPSEPILRVVNPRSKRLDDRYARRSPVVADDRRIFTSATVAAALALAESREQRPATQPRYFAFGSTTIASRRNRWFRAFGVWKTDVGSCILAGTRPLYSERRYGFIFLSSSIHGRQAPANSSPIYTCRSFSLRRPPRRTISRDLFMARLQARRPPGVSAKIVTTCGTKR